MRIDALRSKEGMILLLELDRVPAFAESMGLSLNSEEQREITTSLIDKMVATYSPHMSGVVFSPEHSFDQTVALSKNAAPLFSLERKTAAVDPLVAPSLVDDWGVENIANNYGVAKLELYYHPAEKDAALKKQMVAEIHDYCQYEKIDFLLELLVYHQAQEELSPETLTETQLLAVQEFRNSCDMLALEYLGDSLAAVTITAELDIPWIVTGRSRDYEQTKRELRASLESGAEGFLLGEVFWPETVTAQSQEGAVSVSTLLTEIEHQSDHVLELARIVNEFGSKQTKQDEKDRSEE